MLMRVIRNTDAPWNMFSSHDYWRRNYRELQAEDREIIRRVSRFFVAASRGRPRVSARHRRRLGTNLYPALLMLPWTEKILLTDFSASNVSWLAAKINGRSTTTRPWPWEPFWREMHEVEGYNQIGEPRKHLREACAGEQGLAGIEQRSVFDLPKARWDLGTMFFVAESITEDPAEFRAAVARFIGALKPGAPFAAAFMAGSDGYPVAEPISRAADYRGRRRGAPHRARRERAERGTAPDEAPGAGGVRRNDRGHRLRLRTIAVSERPESHGDPDTAAHP